MFANEEDFRGWLITKISGLIKDRDLPVVVMESKNVGDLILCVENIQKPIALFLELKYYTGSKNRVNIGNSIGSGFQPEILQKKPLFFCKYLKWVLAHEDGYAFFLNTADVGQHISGGGIKAGQQNNIKRAIYDRQDLMDIHDLPDSIIEWVTTFIEK